VDFKGLFKSLSESDRILSNSIKNTLGVAPNNLELYKLALRHKSVAPEIKNGFKNSNERLEFLGDAILDAAVAHYLFGKYPFKDEGFLTKLRAKIVSRTHLNQLAERLSLDQLIESNLELETMKTSVAGDALEALIGAIYLDKGYNKTLQIIQQKLIRDYIDLDALLSNVSDPKSRLIEWCQKLKKNIVFDTDEEESPGHENRYISNVTIDGATHGPGRGLSKKKAEQNAARKALEALKIHKKGA